MRPRRLATLARILAVPLGLALAGSTFALDWTHFRFDEGHTGLNPFEQTLDRIRLQTVRGQLVNDPLLVFREDR